MMTVFEKFKLELNHLNLELNYDLRTQKGHLELVQLSFF